MIYIFLDRMCSNKRVVCILVLHLFTIWMVRMFSIILFWLPFIQICYDSHSHSHIHIVVFSFSCYVFVVLFFSSSFNFPSEMTSFCICVRFRKTFLLFFMPKALDYVWLCLQVYPVHFSGVFDCISFHWNVMII